MSQILLKPRLSIGFMETRAEDLFQSDTNSYWFVNRGAENAGSGADAETCYPHVAQGSDDGDDASDGIRTNRNCYE